MKAAVPSASRIAVLWDLDLMLFEQTWAPPLREAARTFGLEIEAPTLLNDPQSWTQAFVAIRSRKADAALVATGGVIFGGRERLARLAVQHKLPTMSAFKELVLAGG